MTIKNRLITPILKYRFTAPFMNLEASILDYLGSKYYKADRVVWECHRRAAYHAWHAGRTIEELATEHDLPQSIIEWWVHIWECYDRAWRR